MAAFALVTFTPEINAGNKVTSLRVFDPGEEIGVDASGSDSRSVELEALFDALAEMPELYMSLPVDALVADEVLRSGIESPPGTVLIGAGSPIVPVAAGSDVGFRWGQFEESSSVVSDSALGEIPLAGRGQTDDLGAILTSQGAVDLNHPIVALPVELARTQGISTLYRFSEIVESVACYCSEGELQSVAQAMTNTAARYNPDRLYYVDSLQSSDGFLEVAANVSETFDFGMGLAALLSVGLAVVMAGEAFWRARIRVFRTEMLSGAGPLGMVARMQVLLLLAIAVPLVAGFALVNEILSRGAWPGAFDGRQVATALIGIATLHVVISLASVARVRRLYLS